MTFRILQIFSVIGVLGSVFLLAGGQTLAGLLIAVIFVGVGVYATTQRSSRGS